MTLLNYFLNQLEEEAAITRKFLTLLPEDQYQWQPHPKSMRLVVLATHIAELPGWIPMALNTTELDFSVNAYKPTIVASNTELLATFEKNLEEARTRLQIADAAELAELWTLRDGDNIFFTTNKADVIRMSMSQQIHHRAQLGVFLRLLNVPIPGSYGPSADEMPIIEKAEV